jgi:hypothetical protein
MRTLKEIYPPTNEFNIIYAELIKEDNNEDYIKVNIQYQDESTEQIKLLMHDDLLEDINRLSDFELCYDITENVYWD